MGCFYVNCCLYFKGDKLKEFITVHRVLYKHSLTSILLLKFLIRLTSKLISLLSTTLCSIWLSKFWEVIEMRFGVFWISCYKMLLLIWFLNMTLIVSQLSKLSFLTQNKIFIDLKNRWYIGWRERYSPWLHLLRD